MTPRQERLSPQASLDEQLSAGCGSSSSLASSSAYNTTNGTTEVLGKPLLFHDHQQGTFVTKCATRSLHSSSSSSASMSPNEHDPPAECSTNFPNAAQKALLSEVAREQHDYFNLVALLFVIASAAIDWDIKLLFHGLGSLAFKGDYFWLTWGTVFCYFAIDLLWVTRIPHCVKSPRTIVQHHLVVLCYMCAPVFWPEYRWFMGALLSVEINTWFLILRRVVYKKKIVMLSDAVSFSFYLSWIIIRCGIYPAILLHFLHLAKVEIHKTGKFWHWPMVFIPVHFVLCCLNLKWSWDLFFPIIKSWVVQHDDGAVHRKPPGVVSSGL